CCSTRSCADAGLCLGAFVLAAGAALETGVWVCANAPAGSARAGISRPAASAAENQVDLIVIVISSIEGSPAGPSVTVVHGWRRCGVGLGRGRVVHWRRGIIGRLRGRDRTTDQGAEPKPEQG